jgi:methylmalonyl-CoA mutase N-terminal domain/subunit
MKSAAAPAAGSKPAPGASDGAIPGIPPETLSGIPVKPLYTETDLPGDVQQRLTPPGEFPYLRGLHPGMYRTRLWTMRQFAGYGSAAHTNERFHYLLKHGGTGLSTATMIPPISSMRRM